jgi:hypothetical protein
MELRQERRPDHLYVHASGPFDLRQARAGLQAVIAACVDAGLTRILVDGREVTTTISIADRYDLATQLAGFGHGRVRMAIVMSAANLFTKTFEDTALNRGVPMRTTGSMNEALEFLQLAPTDAEGHKP